MKARVAGADGPAQGANLVSAMAPRALALLALPLLVAPRAVALAPTPLAPLSPLEVKRLQVFSAFDDGETRLAMRLIEAAAMEEAETPAASRTRRRAPSPPRSRACGAARSGADGPCATASSRRGATAPRRARRAAAAELGAVAAARWDAAEYEAIARDWAFLPLWQRGAFTEWADAMPATRRALEGALAAGLRLHPLQDFACGVARMEAGSRIAEHCDGGLLSFTCHLGLDVPEGCALTVGGEARRWRAGEFLAFDPSWPHSAENPTAADRYVLLLPLRDGVATTTSPRWPTSSTRRRGRRRTRRTPSGSCGDGAGC
ncbi:peptide-aspartate beta-dioxygenase [Aureococcus anophagefferens]|nr:peptide-aspartate beta-dioxygenase [Aureococcus anophagefferens]